MHLRLLLLALLLSVAACGGEDTNLIAGDDVADIALDGAMDDPASSVADDSGPIEFGTAPTDTGPTTTAPWDVTLREYPLLTLLDESESDAQIGSASFVLVDERDKPIPSGSTDFPAFRVRIEAWYGAANYIEFTLSHTNVQLVDGQPIRQQCAKNWAGLAQFGEGHFQHAPNWLPKVKGTELVWASDGCVEDLPIEFGRLFDGLIEIDVVDGGFLVTDPDSLAEPARFAKLAQKEQRVVSTTQPGETTTTSAGPDS